MEDIEPLPDHASSDLGEALNEVFDSFILQNHKRTDKGAIHDIEPLFRRFLALLWLMDPDRFFEGMSQTDLADYLKVKRATFSRHVRELSELTGIRNRHMKREGAVEVYRERQEKIWEKRKGEGIMASQMFLNVVFQ